MNRSGPAAFAAFMLGTGLITSAAASEHNEGVCAALDSGKVDVEGDPQTVTVTAPPGLLVAGYCVKAGSANQGLGPEHVTLATPVATVTFGHSSGKAVSHWSAAWAPVVVEPPAEEPPAEEPPAPVDLPPVENLAPPVPPVVHVDNGHPIGTPAWRAANPSAVVELG